MRLIHLSDIHIPENGQAIWGVNPSKRLQQVVRCIESIDDIDFIIISGDLSNDGSRWSYYYIDETLSRLNIPIFCCPGNHDDLEEFFHRYTPKHYFRSEKFEYSDWTFLMLNTARSGMSRGFFNHEELESRLATEKNNIGIVMHHPPIEQEGWLNRKLLEDRDEFVNIIKRHPNVKLILYGHTHYPICKIIDGVVYSSAPSVGFAFDPTLPKFEIAHGDEGFSIIDISEESISVTVKSIDEYGS